MDVIDASRIVRSQLSAVVRETRTLRAELQARRAITKALIDEIWTEWDHLRQVVRTSDRLMTRLRDEQRVNAAILQFDSARPLVCPPPTADFHSQVVAH